MKRKTVCRGNMEPKLTYTGKVLDSGEIKVHRAKEMRELIAYNFAGKDIEITIQRKRRRRTVQMNSYYWGVMVPLVASGLQDAGYRVDRESTHEFLKSTFNKKEIVNEDTGEILHTIGSTSQMSTVEMMEYFAEITQWSAEFLNIEIPLPGEQIRINI